RNGAAMPLSWPTCNPSPPPSIGVSNAACGENCVGREAPLDRFGQPADSFCGDRAGGSAGSRKRHVEAAKGAAQGQNMPALARIVTGVCQNGSYALERGYDKNRPDECPTCRGAWRGPGARPSS